MGIRTRTVVNMFDSVVYKEVLSEALHAADSIMRILSLVRLLLNHQLPRSREAILFSTFAVRSGVVEKCLASLFPDELYISIWSKCNRLNLQTLNK